MSDWETAVMKQAATWAFYGTDEGTSFLRSFKASQDGVEPENAPLLSYLNHNVLSTLWNADPIYVTNDMMDVLEAAWPSFAEEPLREEDLFIPCGLVYLPRPIKIKDWRGNPIGHRAIGWLPSQRAEDGLRATFVTTYSNAADVVEDEAHAATVSHRSGIRPEDALRARNAVHKVFGYAMVLNYASPMPFGQTVAQMLERTATEDETQRHLIAKNPAVIESTTNLLRFLQALWRLLGQRVAVGMEHRPSRATRRDAKRMQYPEKYVTVITLRRPKGPTSGEHRQVDWAQRWIVSAHWHTYHTLEGPKQLWVAPFVKGPEDKPLVVRGARVFRVAR